MPNVLQVGQEVTRCNSGVASAWDGGLDLRSDAASVGLQVVRVATAAARLLEGRTLTARDTAVLDDVSRTLRLEAKVLRHEADPSQSDESAYAFAGAALTVVKANQATDEDTSSSAAAQTLDSIAGKIDQMQDGSADSKSLETVEELFFQLSDLILTRNGSTGETLDGQVDRVPARTDR